MSDSTLPSSVLPEAAAGEAGAMIPESEDRERDQDREIQWEVDLGAGAEMLPSEDAVRPLHDVKKRFGKNVLTTIAARFLIMARGVLLVPFTLSHVGLEAYGIWTTAFLLVSYVGITTLGLSNVYIKYAAEFHARREYHKANALLSTGLSITIPLCTAIFLGFVFGWNWYSPLLRLPPAHAGDGKEAVLIVLAVFLSSISLNGFADILTGTQEIVATQVFSMMSIVVEGVLIFVLVGAGRGIRGLAEAYLARILVNDGLTIWYAWYKLKWLHLSPRLVSREAIKYVVHFGGVVQFETMLAIFLQSVERVAALGFINAAAAGLLDIGKKWPSSLSTVPMSFFAALLPAAAHVDAASARADRWANLRTLYLSSSRYANLSTAAFNGAMVFWAGPIMHVWLGSALPTGQRLVSLFVVFSLAMQMHMLTGPGTSMFRGMGKIYEEFIYALPNLLLLCITLPAARLIEGRWTPLGIGVAVGAATAVSACIFLGRVNVVLELSLGRYLKEVIVPGLIPYFVAALLALPVARLTETVDRWRGVGIMFSAGILYAIGSVALLYVSVLTSEERQKGLRLFQKGLGVLRGGEATA